MSVTSSHIAPALASKYLMMETVRVDWFTRHYTSGLFIDERRKVVRFLTELTEKSKFYRDGLHLKRTTIEKLRIQPIR